jgi:hypothetical protein
MGFAGLVLSALLDEDGFFRGARAAGPVAPDVDPLAPKPPHFPARAKSVIFLYMTGGPSHVDLFDPKPALTANHRKTVGSDQRTLLGSPFRFTRHGGSGIEVSEVLPHLAGCVDDLAIIRSMHADSSVHAVSMLQMNTGSLLQGRPSLGSWVSYGLGTENRNLPSFVVLLDPHGGPYGGAANWAAGYMPVAFQGTPFRNQGAPLLDLSPRAPVTRAEQRAQLDLLAQLNGFHRATRPHESELAARIASYELAFRMQVQAPEAVDLASEPAETKALYGLDDPPSADFGRKCLLARRLVERGVRFVQIYSGGFTLNNDEVVTWDAHSDVAKNHRLKCAETDKPIAGLIADLKRRGLLDETLIVWSGEFGRSPTSQNGNGRDHHPKGFTAWLAGGGVKGGTIVGATDEIGFAAAEDKVHVHDLHATILHLLGIDHTLLTFFHGGREQRLTDVEGKVVKQVLG